MEEALRFVHDYEIYIYIILGVVAAWYLRKFMVAWGELREAAFGLERETAQARLNWSASVLVFVLILGVVEFALVSYVVPTVPGAAPIFTPTLDLLATPTVTLDANSTPGIVPTLGATLPPGGSGCVPGQIEITAPTAGASVRGLINIIGTANIPNFGFYKYETAQVNDSTWLTLQAGNVTVVEDVLGPWDTARLTPGDYYLRLVVTDNAGQALAPCTIQVRVEAPPEE
ncbi:MAG TPA: hypothetical protein DEH25_05580 [Chloroflexi bacterium]|nr:hypothetical protein [Chloroflexota bacterium]HBY09518.1 hypothetical protein [Chloroflexota bacterium]